MREQDRQIINMVNNIGKPVRLALIDNTKGKIIAVYIDDGEPTYNTAYFMNGDRRTCYFAPNEVEVE